MKQRSPSSLGGRLLLVVLAPGIPMATLVVTGKLDLLDGLATLLTLVVVWLGCKWLVLRPLNALVNAARQAAGEITSFQAGPAFEVAEFAQLAAAINEMVSAVRDRSVKRRLSNQRYQRLVECLPEAMFVKQAGKIALVNPAAMRLLGATSAAQLAGKTMEEMIHPDSRAAFAQHITRLKNGLQPPLLEGKFLRLDDTTVDVEITAAVLGDQGEPEVQLIARDITPRKQAERQLRELSQRLQKAQDEERRRIARDLHDSTAQELAAIVTSLGLIEEAVAGTDGPVRKRCTESRELAEHCATRIRATSYLLHPPFLDELGLAMALKNHVEGFAKRSHIRIAVCIPDDIGRLTHEMELALFRVAQESLSNIQRHSGSSTANVRLLQDGESIVLEVQDQGCGLPFAVAADAALPLDKVGVGIAGMRERIQHLGGRLSLLSNPQGTTVRATLPRK